MTSTDLRGTAVRIRRKLPKQLTNEAKMIEAAIVLLAERPVAEVTSRRIAEESGTSVSHLSRYWGGRDEFFVAVARELGQRITVLIRAEESQFDLEEIGAGFQRFLAIDEVAIWFKLYRYLAGREQFAGLGADGPPALLTAVQDGLAFVFGVDRDECLLWATLLLTYLVGSQVFGQLLGTTPEVVVGVMDLLGDAIKMRAAAVAAVAAEPVEPVEPVVAAVAAEPSDEGRDRKAGRRGTDRFLAS